MQDKDKNVQSCVGSDASASWTSGTALSSSGLSMENKKEKNKTHADELEGFAKSFDGKSKICTSWSSLPLLDLEPLRSCKPPGCFKR